MRDSGVLVDHGAERPQRRGKVARHVVALTEPVLRVVGHRTVRKAGQQLLEPFGRLRVLAVAQQVERRLVIGAIVAAGNREPVPRRSLLHLRLAVARLQRLQPLAQVVIEFALLLARTLVAELQLLDLAPKRARLCLGGLEPLREVEQALVGQHPFKPQQAAVQL